MLEITVPGTEFYDEKAEKFVKTKSVKLRMEHSLVSIAKWEARWHKSFLSTDERTREEMISYMQCMTITQNVPFDVYFRMSPNNLNDILEYINDPRTATTFRGGAGKPSREIITAELIYYWMIAYNIPFECQKWHINRLLTLIRVCNIKNQPPKKMKAKEALAQQRRLNAERRASLGTSG